MQLIGCTSALGSRATKSPHHTLRVGGGNALQVLRSCGQSWNFKQSNPCFMPSAVDSIKFGTDGWRGVIADDFTFERVALVAPLAAQVLAQTSSSDSSSGTVIVGHD